MKQNVFPRQRIWLSGQDSQQEWLLCLTRKMGVRALVLWVLWGDQVLPWRHDLAARGAGGRGGPDLHRAVVNF